MLARPDLQRVRSFGLRPSSSRLAAVVAAAAACALGCAKGAPFEGLAQAQSGTGPRVVFDLLRTPLPEIPFPNDIATRPDPTAPTGLRVNASLVAGTRLERSVRGLLDNLDGFGTFAPITVAFDQDLDVDDLYARQNDADPSNDAVFLLDLASGERQALDLNGGHYPVEVAKPDQYFLDDPLSKVTNLLFQTSGPFANYLHPDDPSRQATPALAASDLLTFYERSTRTLILRPVLPLQSERRYAVVLTTRLHGKDGSPVRSPFPGINHAAQTQQLSALPQILPAGTTLADVAFAWSFTTQSTWRDLVAVRDGLNGTGPLQALSIQYPVQIGLTSSAGQAGYATRIKLFKLVDNPGLGGPYALPGDKVRELLADPQISKLLGFDGPDVKALTDSLKYVDYFVGGSYESPDFLYDPDRRPFDWTFRFDLSRASALATSTQVPFFIAVPKATPLHRQPFPAMIIGHGYKSTRFEGMIGFAGTYAKFGIASVAIDAYGHGIAIDPVQQLLARSILAAHGVGAFADALFTGRARDLDNSGIPTSGGDFWTADAFHTRDVVRQSVIDWMQLVRVLRSFDGRGLMILDSTTNPPLAGDFNNDGVPDLGGPVLWPADIVANDGTKLYAANAFNPASDTFYFGQSLGGILGSVLAAVEPAIKVAAPGSTAGGLSDVVLRSTEPNVVKAALLEIMGPIVALCGYDPARGQCGSGPQTLVLDVQNVNREAILPIAPVTLAAGDRVTVLNTAITTADASCASAPLQGCQTGVVDAQGRLRLGIAADWPSVITGPPAAPHVDGVPDKPTVTVLRPGDPLTLRVDFADGRTPQVIDSWARDVTFQGITYRAGAKLTSPARGYGYARNSPDFRRLVGLSQMILEAGDPINYAPHYFKDPNITRGDRGVNVLLFGTVGDTTVPLATDLSLARAAGILDPSAVDPDYGMSLDQVLIQSGVTEGLAGLSRYKDPASGPRAALGAHIRCDPPADCSKPVLLDPTGYACDDHGQSCTDGFAVPRLDPGLKNKLILTTGAGGKSGLVLEYLDPHGDHSFKNPHPGKPFDADLFFANLIGRYFETRGQEVHFDACQQYLAACPWIPQPP